MKKLFLIVPIALLQACATVGSLDRPQSYYGNDASSAQEAIIGEPVLGEDNNKIKELLYYRVKLPQKNRIAVLKLSKDNYWRFYSNDFTELNNSLIENLISKLRSSNRVYDASFLPAMLVSEKRTVPALREAAARFQADLLLGYRSSCNSFQKYRFISPNETRSYCSVEAVLLDTRSGVVAKSIVSTESFNAKKDSSDKNFSETVKKAELEAIARALGRIANEIIAYLNNVPVK